MQKPVNPAFYLQVGPVVTVNQPANRGPTVRTNTCAECLECLLTFTMNLGEIEVNIPQYTIHSAHLFIYSGFWDKQLLLI